MTIKELKKALETYDENLEVITGCGEICNIEILKTFDNEDCILIN